MATKQSLNINFSLGIDTKTDPFQVQHGKFLSLVNSIFSKGKMLQKRNGYGSLTALPSTASYLTTFNEDLTAVGFNLQAFSTSTNSWYNKGSFQPVSLSTLPLVRNNTNQSQCDSVTAPSGLICTVYTDQSTSNTSIPAYKYVISDNSTGQNIVAPALISGASSFVGTPRVFLLNNYFIIVYTNGSNNLAYIAVSTANPTITSGPITISTSFTPFASMSFDGVVYGDALYLAWDGGGGSGIKMTYLTSQLALGATKTPDAVNTASIVSVCADETNSVIWVAYSAGGHTSYTLALDTQLNVLSGFPVLTVNGSANIINLAPAAQSGVMTLCYETVGAYSYDSSIPTNLTQTVTVTQLSAAVGSPATLKRGVGLASKSFILSSTQYVLLTYQSPYQNTYFLSDSSGNVCAKLAYQNGGGYLTTGLPSFSISGSTVSIAYLIKDLIQSVNKNTNVPSGSQVAGIYSQTGINLASFTIGSKDITSSEIGGNLNLNGGFLNAYDGYSITEQGFHLYPDSVEVTTNTGVTPTGDTTNGSKTILNLSSAASVGIGCTITGTGIPGGTTITAVNGNALNMSAAATATNSGTTLTIKGSLTAQIYYYQAVYEWTDNQGNLFRSAPSVPVTVTSSTATSTNTVSVPTLRLTSKTANPIKIVVYRWSTAQQTYYQATSLTYPVLNSVSSDSISFVDSLSDATILGNNILYTTGGVLENIGPPSFVDTFLFDDRLWGIDSEDQNLLWYSKQVIESTPVEMSDLLTIYVNPNIGAQGPTGPMTCGAAMDDKAILFKATAINYINGTGPDNTGANSQYGSPTFITSTVGCSNPKSIIFQPNGLMFEFSSEAGNQIWLLGRDLSTTYIGDAVEAFTQEAAIQSAVIVPGTNFVLFTLDSGITLMYDYYYQQWGTFAGVPAVSSTIFQGLHTYINSSGLVFQETPGAYLDGANPVLISFTTGWLNAAGIRGYERIYEFSFLGVYYSPHQVIIDTAYDYGQAFHRSVYNPTNFAPAYGAVNTVFGSNTPYGGPGNMENFKVSTKKQKCKSFQIKFQEVYDPSFGVAAGQGLSLSGINCVIGIKKSYAPIRGSDSIG